MNVFAVGDALLPERYVKDGLKKFIERGDQVNVISWGEDDEAIIDQRARLLRIKRSYS